MNTMSILKYLFVITLSVTNLKTICQTSIDDLSTKFEKNKVSVLMIYAYSNSNEKQGSGFIISQEGLAISNYHVFEGATNVTVNDYQGNEYNNISVLFYDEAFDFVVFKIEGIKHPPVKIAKNLPKIGDPCFAIGNPLGLEQTLSTGIISGYRDNDNYIQTSAEITFGSSGGPLFNSEGEAIGITTAGAGQANLNFAINLLKIDTDTYNNRIDATPDQIVRAFITYLGNGKFREAFYLSENPLWNKNGGLRWFESKTAYGAITSTDIREIKVENINNNSAIVYAHYYAQDPLNISKYWQQNFYLEKRSFGWVIVKLKLK